MHRYIFLFLLAVVTLTAHAQVAVDTTQWADTLAELVVEGHQRGMLISRSDIAKRETITMTGLAKMACCTVAESFENSATVSVGYSDAVTGTRQIKMLGLAGTYTQMLDESRPVMRGLVQAAGLNYTPGVWLKSIQVSKGVASVSAGHEAITGQINLEHRKPTDTERLFVNVYLDDMLRPEVNLSSAIPLKQDKSLSTVLLAHGAADTDWRDMGAMDRNRDGFRDTPRNRQLDVANRWIWITPSGTQMRWGWKLTGDKRNGGQLHGDYLTHVTNREGTAYLKVAIPVGNSVIDSTGNGQRDNIAFVTDFNHFDTRSRYGLNTYTGHQNLASMSVLYNHHMGKRTMLAAGVQAHLDYYREQVGNNLPAEQPSEFITCLDEREAGAYAEFTHTVGDRLTLVGGLRADHNSAHHRWIVTPRAHVKWNVTPSTTLRASAGLGSRTPHLWSDSPGILSTGRRVQVASLDLERALTAGGSLTQSFALGSDPQASLSVDYFRTRFYNSVVVDMEYDPTIISVYSTRGRAYTDTWQLDFNWTPVDRLDILATMRYNRSRTTINRPDGTATRVNRPLINAFKGLVNVSYATRFRVWVFDVTAQLNGPARIPSPTGRLADDSRSPTFATLFAQVTHKVGRADIYLGCENITDYRQQTVIDNADRPFATDFNPTNVWGPLMGRKFYAGVRINFY